METWTAVPNYEGWYEISDHGRVRKIRRSRRGHANTSAGRIPHIMAPLLYKKGYFKIHFASCDGTKPEKRMFLHRAVWTAFHGPIPHGITVNHKDGIKANNWLDNLELATHKQQAAHAEALGLKYHPENGERRSTAKLTDAQAREILRRHREGTLHQTRLAKEWGYSQTGISAIVHGKRWKHIAL